jgi:hypothetical protein
MTRYRLPARPTRRQVRNDLALLDALANGTTPVIEQTTIRKRGKQHESAVGDANRQWARLKGGRLYRNRRGLIDLPNGGKLPVGLGPNGFPDEVGYLPVRITQAMVGRVLPVFCCIEDKTDNGVVAAHQLACIEELRDANAIAGVSRGIDDSEALLARWMERVGGDER